jgi:hypothetical protein
LPNFYISKNWGEGGKKKKKTLGLPALNPQVQVVDRIQRFKMVALLESKLSLSLSLSLN